MKIKCFVATRDGQGRRKSDFNFCDEGELVMFGSECDRDRCDIDGSCGCLRSLVGMITHTGTTTVRVVEKEMSAADFTHLQLGALQEMGFIRGDSGTAIKESYALDAQSLLETAEKFPVGAVVEKRGNSMQQRL